MSEAHLPSPLAGVSFGVRTDNGYPLSLEAAGTDLLIFGSPGCGKSHTVKKLALRLAHARIPAVVLAECSHAHSHVARRSRELGSGLSPGPGDGFAPYTLLEYERHKPPPAPFEFLQTLQHITSAGDGRAPMPRAEHALDPPHPRGYLLLDSLELAPPEEPGRWLLGLRLAARSAGFSMVATIADTERFLDQPESRALLDYSSLFAMHTWRRDGAALSRTLGQATGTTDASRLLRTLAAQRPGEGLLLRTQCPPLPVYIDCTPDEMRLFETRTTPSAAGSHTDRPSGEE